MFYLSDGKAIFYIGKIITKDGEYKYATEDEKEEILKLLDEEDEKDYTIELLELPSQQILDKAKQLEGKTYSKTEFEKLLLNDTPTGTNEKIQELETALLEATTLIALQEQKSIETEHAILELTKLIGGMI